ASEHRELGIEDLLHRAVMPGVSYLDVPLSCEVYALMHEVCLRRSGPMISRYGLSIGIALAVTFGLLFIMQPLIASGRSDTQSRHSITSLDFVRIERPATPERKRDKPEKPPEPAEQPELPQSSAQEEIGRAHV